MFKCCGNRTVSFLAGYALVNMVIVALMIFVIIILHLMIRKFHWNPKTKHIAVRIKILKMS